MPKKTFVKETKKYDMKVKISKVQKVIFLTVIETKFQNDIANMPNLRRWIVGV
jgi:hypothetical protein